MNFRRGRVSRHRYWWFRKISGDISAFHDAQSYEGAWNSANMIKLWKSTFLEIPLIRGSTQSMSAPEDSRASTFSDIGPYQRYQKIIQSTWLTSYQFSPTLVSPQNKINVLTERLIVFGRFFCDNILTRIFSIEKGLFFQLESYFSKEDRQLWKVMFLGGKWPNGIT
jgi:hypothetical protein